MNPPATVRALLIEDSLGDALMLEQRLARGNGARVEVERATTLRQGLDYLGKGRTDVVLLDLHLPDSSGSETVRRVREAYPRLPIVVFSSGGDPGLPMRSLQAGAQDYLGKNDFESEPLRDYERAEISSMRSLDVSQFVLSERPQIEAIAGPGISIEYELESPGPTVSANPVDLRQVLFNLVINASESIRPASGSICIETGNLWADSELLATGRGVTHLDEGMYVLLSVHDSGRGLDGHALSRIFDPFYTTKITGRGLGLAAALSAVRRHGGWIGAGNGSGGRGARFQVLLPIAA